MTIEQKENLLREIEKLHQRYELSKVVTPDYFEPGMMEDLDKSEGMFDETSGDLVIRFESRGTRYDGRTEQLEKVSIGDKIIVSRDEKNQFNHNNFLLLTENGHDVGCMPAELCNVIAPLYDEGSLIFKSAKASYVEPISLRNRHATKSILFVELKAKLIYIDGEWKEN